MGGILGFPGDKTAHNNGRIVTDANYGSHLAGRNVTYGAATVLVDLLS